MSESFRNENEAPQIEAQVRLAAIVESSDDAIVSKNLQGFVLTWNKGAERIFGYTSDEMVGQHISKIIPDDRQQEEPMILSRLQRGERVDHFETIRRHKQGKPVEVSVTISPVRDVTGRIIGASKIVRDISLQKQFQRELVAARKAAESAREMAEAANKAKDHFLSVLSHELRTPLTPVLGVISFLEGDQSLPQPLREQLSMIRRNVETEARLVDDLLDLTRIARGKIQLHFEVVDSHAVLRNVVKMFQVEIDEKALALTMALRAKEFHVWADPGRFQQTVLNVISNAVKFTPNEGSVTIRTSNIDSQLKIEITDSGIGIDDDLMPRLFTPFEQGEQTVTRQFGGLGLGLSIVKSLMGMHDGTVSVTSEGKDRGSTFTLQLPTVSPTHAEVTGTTGGGRQRAGYRILLVEDHADTRYVMTVLLRSFGCVVSAAGSVKEALEFADREKFDLLISDIGLPDGTGIDVMRYVNKRQPVKAIAISGFGQEDDLRRSREAGFATHLTKPINLRTLQEAIDSTVD